MTAAVSEEWHRGDWLEWRRAGIGASDVAGILGISPFASPYSVWASKVHSVDAEETEPMRWGHLLEDAIADEFAVRTGLHVSHAQEWAQHPDRSWARCTLDRKVFDDVGGTDPLGELEIKTTSARAWETFGDELPEYYLAQVMWQLFVTGLERAWVATLVGGQRLHIGDPIERDDRVIADLVVAVEAFWLDHVITGIAPPADEGDPDVTADVLARRWADEVDDEETITLGHDELVAWGELRLYRNQQRDLDARIEARRNLIRASMGSAKRALTPTGQTAATWGAVTEVDVEALTAAHPEVAAAFTETRFRSTEFKKAHPKLHAAFRRPTGARRFMPNFPKD